MQDKPLVWMHPTDASERDIKNSDEVWVESLRGKVRFWAHITEDIVQGVVETNMGGGGPLGPKEWHPLKGPCQEKTLHHRKKVQFFLQGHHPVTGSAPFLCLRP